MKAMATDALAEKLLLSIPETEQVLQLYDLSTTDIGLLASCRVAMFGKLEVISKDVAEQALEDKEVAGLIGEVSSAEAFPKHVRNYLRDYFEGAFDREYIESRYKLGTLLYRFNIPPRKFMPLLGSMQRRIEIELLSSLGKTDAGALATRSYGKLMQLDSLVVMQAYQDAAARNDMMQENKLKEHNKMLEKKVADLTMSLESLSQKDSLTGLYNQRGFYDHLYRELGNAKRLKWGLCVVYFDFNGFSDFNEKEGRRVGDKLLNIMAATMADTYRETDILCRYRDDQFCAIMPNTVARDATMVCRRVIEKFRSRSSYSLAFCIGLAQTGPTDFISPDDLFAAALENLKVAQAAISDKGEFFLKG